MREILFRGKRKDNGEWVEGHYTIDTICGDDTYLSPVIHGNPKHIYDCSWFEVIPETVGQFTGLTDKNGKKIFEGDIVVSYDMFGRKDDCGIVNWNDLFVSWHIGEHSMYNRIATYEVIGNTHDST